MWQSTRRHKSNNFTYCLFLLCYLLFSCLCLSLMCHYTSHWLTFPSHPISLSTRQCCCLYHFILLIPFSSPPLIPHLHLPPACFHPVSFQTWAHNASPSLAHGLSLFCVSHWWHQCWGSVTVETEVRQRDVTNVRLQMCERVLIRGQGLIYTDVN